MVFLRQQPHSPWKSPHLPPSSLGFEPLIGGQKGGTALPRSRLTVLACAALGTFLLLSFVSPFRPFSAFDDGHQPFKRKGMAPALFTELDKVDHRAVILRPVERSFERERSPEDPVSWSATPLLPARRQGKKRKPAILRLAGTEDASGDGGALVRHDADAAPIPSHKVEVFPRKIHLAPNSNGVGAHVPTGDKLLFGIVTTTERATKMSELWTRWMVPRYPDDEAAPACLILVSEEETQEDIQELEEVLRQRQVQCGIRRGKHKRYEVRVLSMIREMKDHAAEVGLTPDWYIFNDDDTFWLDMRATRRMLSKYDPAKEWFVGSTTEAEKQLAQFGRMLFGGGGALVSRALMSSMYDIWDECYDRFKDAFGGDEMLTRCAATATGLTKSTVTTEEKGLHQFDIPGDTTGVLQGGIPMLSLHHFLGGGWVHLFGYGSTHSDMDQIRRIRTAADFLGGDNMFQRYVFGDGKWLLTMGYSVSFYEKPLTREDMAAMEHTWYDGYRLCFDDRPFMPERHGPGPVKQTFYIESTEVISPKSALFTFIQADSWDEHLSYDERVRLQVLWDGDSAHLTREQDPAALS
ncbi:hypothetical protein NBRC10513v2_004866 [Rhodotorula toruloides]|uniref:BY PROTMAP: gi/472581523/gb/EMS19257.1/ glycosyltransferase family 31 protein [Rhodosporidium toruloides NP11] gi/647397024/emb/CDR39791.1/ RHTO0S04e09538g1_1 [Rhodosporidium toruloides] n=1 Tax=Rhodotorula toruloides TaxID=5286 RepID=A0A0K3C773_RHOTO|nr:Protein of unknown function, DUF604-domain containing protein [Rhodotorula toruloides]